MCSRILRNRIEEWIPRLHGPTPGLSRRVANTGTGKAVIG